MGKPEKLPDSATASYRVGYSIGRILPLMGSSLGLYALVFNRSVKRYFNDDSDEMSLDSMEKNVGMSETIDR